MQLYNKINKELLKKQLEEESFKRKTISFYRYTIIDNPQKFRDQLYTVWNKLQCLGRIYVAREGINAQMSVPEHTLDDFLNNLQSSNFLKDMPIKYAIEDDGKSFYKLTIKVRPKIVADGLDDNVFDVTNVGNHLSAIDFHNLVQDESSLVIDMRNHYESEVGHFEGAICPDADTFRDEIQMVVNELEDKKHEKVLLYCTGGIRCEKASAYLKHHGFTDVNQLHGGIIEYAQQIKNLGLESKFIGKNFVFDERLGESISGKIISHCHQCGKISDSHTNCANDICHLLFIQCQECQEIFNGCCSVECKEILTLPQNEQKRIGKEMHKRFGESKIFKSRLRPELKNQTQLIPGVFKVNNEK